MVAPAGWVKLGFVDLADFAPLHLWSQVRGGKSALGPLEWEASEGGQCLLLLS